MDRMDEDKVFAELDALENEQALDEQMIKSALSVESELGRQKALMILESKARKIGQIRNFAKIVKIISKQLVAKKTEESFTTMLEDVDIVYNTGDWICDDQGVRRFVEKNGATVEEVASWQPVVIKNIFYNYEMNTYRVQLAFKESAISPTKTITVNKSIIANSSSITALADYGISITNQSAPLFVKYLNDLERLNVTKIPRNQSISRVGWVNDTEFVPYNSLICFDGETAYKEIYNAISTKGDLDEWKRMVKDNDSLISRIILGASFASPLVGLLDSLNFFVHIWGDSGTGKSVALYLAESVWGNPVKLVQNLNGTAVALERLAGFFCNLPLCLDELQTLKRNNFGRESSYDDILYKLGQGRGKSRGRKDGSIDSVATWGLSIITTGEEPITSESSGGGAKNRVLDVYVSKDIFKNPTSVIRGAFNNYGMAGKMFIENLIDYIVKNGKQKLLDMYEMFYDAIMQTMPTGKQAMSATMVALGYALSQMFVFGKSQDDAELIGLAMLQELRPMLLSLTEINNMDNVLNDILSYAFQNKHHFSHKVSGYSDYNPVDNRLELWGKIDMDTVYIANNVLQKYCNDTNKNYRKITKGLYDRGMALGRVLPSGTTEYTKPVKIGGNCVRCVCIKIPDEKKLDVELIEATEIDPSDLPF